MPTPSILIDPIVALTLLKQWTEWNSDPSIASEIEGILARHQVATIWQPDTDYSVGDVVLPTLANRNFHSFVCTVPGKSASFEPAWVTATERCVFDNTVKWREDGVDYGYQLWDLRGAAYECWLLKQSKLVDAIDFTIEGQTLKRNQLVENIERMLERFAPVILV